MTKHLITIVITVGLAWQPARAQTLAEIVDASDRIVIAEAIDHRPDRAHVVLVTFQVHETLKGAARYLVPLEFFEDTIEVGDRAVLFVSRDAAGIHVVEPRGQFPINRGPDGIDYVTLHDRRAFSAVDQIGSPIVVSTVPVRTMTLDAFSAAIGTPTVDGAGILPDVSTSVIPFPPRDQTFGFFMTLENEYRDGLGRSPTNKGFVNAEGSAVWFPEWLRYVLNRCSPSEATNRVLMQIRGQGIQPVCGVVPPGVINFPPRNESLDFLKALDTFYRDELNRNIILSHIDLEGKAVWLQEYLRYRVNGCSDQEASQKVINQIRTGRIAPLCGPKTTFGSGQHLVGTDIAAGRYFSKPVDGCYWERLSGFSGNLADIIANESIGYDAGQEIVDILPTDSGFSNDAECGTWFDTPRGGASPTSILPGNWLVGSQVVPGTYRAQAAPGCYWERLRDFSGQLSGIIANDFVSEAGQQIVTIDGSETGFDADSDCGPWTRVSSLGRAAPSRRASPDYVQHNWELNRRQEANR